MSNDLMKREAALLTRVADLQERLAASMEAAAQLRAALQTIHATFQRDIEQGYTSKDKTFAIAITRDALEGERGTK